MLETGTSPGRRPFKAPMRAGDEPMTRPNGEAVVRVENLYKRFGELEVLRGINMEVDKGEVVVIFGRSGSGKSTLLRCVNFLEDPTDGIVEVSGIRLEGGHRTRGKREQIRLLRLHAGMVFQQFNLFPHLTVINNVMEGPVTVKGMSEGSGSRHRFGAVGQGRSRREGRRVPDPVVGRATATRRDRARARDGARRDVVR